MLDSHHLQTDLAKTFAEHQQSIFEILAQVEDSWNSEQMEYCMQSEFRYQQRMDMQAFEAYTEADFPKLAAEDSKHDCVNYGLLLIDNR